MLKLMLSCTWTYLQKTACEFSADYFTNFAGCLLNLFLQVTLQK